MSNRTSVLVMTSNFIWKDKVVHIFLKSIRTKVNVIAQLEFELVYFEAAVRYFSHNATGTSPVSVCTCL